jgi:hypothetical protein
MPAQLASRTGIRGGSFADDRVTPPEVDSKGFSFDSQKKVSQAEFKAHGDPGDVTYSAGGRLLPRASADRLVWVWEIDSMGQLALVLEYVGL